MSSIFFFHGVVIGVGVEKNLATLRLTCKSYVRLPHPHDIVNYFFPVTCLLKQCDDALRSVVAQTS